MKKQNIYQKAANRWEAFVKKKSDNVPEADTRKAFDEDAIYNLLIHYPDNFNGLDIVLNPEIFPNVKERDILLISDLKNNNIIVQVKSESLTQEIKNKNFHLSLSKNISENYELDLDLSNKANVRVKSLIDTRDFELDFVEVSFKDQFVSRRDMHKINKSLVGCVIHTSKQILEENTIFKILNMISKNTVVHSGMVTNNTKIVFRSLSARLFIMLELSKELFEYDVYGELYFDIMLRTLKSLLQRMELLHTKHKISFIVFARLFYPQFKSIIEAREEVDKLAAEPSETHFVDEIFGMRRAYCFQIDSRGRVYQDLYKKITFKRSEKIWTTNLIRLKKNILGFLDYINWVKETTQAIKLMRKNDHIIKIANPNQSQASPNLGAKKFKGIIGEIELSDDDDDCGDLCRDSGSDINLLSSSYLTEKKNCEMFKMNIECELANSDNCNMVEALNLVIQSLSLHRMNRNLYNCGQCIIVISAGEGKYYLDEELSRLTKECLVLSRATCHLISLRENANGHTPKYPTFCLYDSLNIQNNFFCDYNDPRIKSLFKICYDEYLNSKQVLENTSFEPWKKFFESENADEREGPLLLYKNYLGLSTLKEHDTFVEVTNDINHKFICNNSHPVHYMVCVDKSCLSGINGQRSFREKKSIIHKIKTPYWISLHFLVDYEMLFAHAQIYPLPKINPDPFLSLTNITHPIYKPMPRLKAYMKTLKAKKPANTTNDIDKMLQTLLKPNISVSSGDYHSYVSKDLVVYNMSEYDKNIFNKPIVRETPEMGPIAMMQSASPAHPVHAIPEFVLDSGRSSYSDKTESILAHCISASFKSGFLTGIPKTSSAEFLGDKFSTSSPVNIPFSFIGGRMDNNTNSYIPNTPNFETSSINDENLNLTKKYSHYRVRWFNLYKESTLAETLQKMVLIENNGKLVNLPENWFAYESFWKDLVFPPLLPLKTSFYPSELELNTLSYEKNVYYLSLTGGIKKNVLDFIQLLVNHRLALDFQIVDDQSFDTQGKAICGLAHEKSSKLSFGNVHHKVTLKVNDNLICNSYSKNKKRKIGSIEKKLNVIPIYYNYLIYNERVKSFVKKAILFEAAKQINWNKFDGFATSFIKDYDLIDVKEVKDQLKEFRAYCVNLVFLPFKKKRPLPCQQNEEKIFKVKRDKELISSFEKFMSSAYEKIGLKYKIEINQILKRKKLKQLPSDTFTKMIKIYTESQATGFSHYFFEFDGYFCPKTVYHIAFYWFSCSSQLISELVKSLATLAKNQNFDLKYISSRYREIFAAPFDPNIKINIFNPRIIKQLKKSLKYEPFNFFYDCNCKEYTVFIHESALIILYIYSDFIIWKENSRFEFLNVQQTSTDSDRAPENLFRKLIRFIKCLHIIYNIVENIEILHNDYPDRYRNPI